MGQEFEEQAHDAACKAVWHLIAADEVVSQEAIAGVVVELSQYRDALAVSIALAVLYQA